MSLFALVRVTTSAEHSVPVGVLDIRRQEDLDLTDKTAIADEVCTYTVRIDGRERATVRHRYGDGAWVLMRKALEAAVELPGPVDLHEPCPDDVDGEVYFADLVRRLGRCTCRSDVCGDAACALCGRLDPDWPCPATGGYEQVTGEALA